MAIKWVRCIREAELPMQELLLKNGRGAYMWRGAYSRDSTVHAHL